MARSDPVWVFVDARYERFGDGWRGEVPALGVAVTTKAREEAADEVARAVAKHLRPFLIAGTLPAHLEELGFYLNGEGEWVPRITGEDERLYVRVTPIESLPLHRAGEAFEPEDPAE